MSKASVRLESYGTIDELNSNIGMLRNYIKEKEANECLEQIQKDLFVVGAHLATEFASEEEADTQCATLIEKTENIEKEIDRIEALLPPMKCFILPGGSISSSWAHICRTVARRAERAIVRLMESEEEENEKQTWVSSAVVKYVNRLSDYFFVLARNNA